MKQIIVYATVSCFSFFGFVAQLPAAISSTTHPSMLSWGVEEWVTFLGAIGVCATVFAAAFAKVMSSIKELRATSKSNAIALVPLIEANKSQPGPSVDPVTEAAVRKTANGGCP